MKAVNALISFSTSVAPLLRTTSVNGTGIDLANFGGNTFAFVCGANTDGTHTPKLQDSADNSTFADVVAADQVGTLSALSANTIQKASYIGSKRYVRAVITTTGSPATGANIGVVAALTNGRLQS
jgi:hypothetical protein